MSQDEKCLESVLKWIKEATTTIGGLIKLDSKSRVWQVPASLTVLETILFKALNFPEIVVIVDAIDEGENEREVVSILIRLAKMGAKVLMTSRPDVTISRAFETNKDQADDLKKIAISQLVLTHDIQTYISIQLDSLLQSREVTLRDPQLKPEIVKALTERSEAM